MCFALVCIGLHWFALVLHWFALVLDWFALVLHWLALVLHWWHWFPLDSDCKLPYPPTRQAGKTVPACLLYIKSIYTVYIYCIIYIYDIYLFSNVLPST
jgi:hypothetical protein